MKKFLWLLASCLMVLSLVVASCGNGAEVEEEEEAEGLRPPTEPIYGGTLTVSSPWGLSVIDPINTQAIRVGHMQYTSNELIQGDWTKGPQGTGETVWEYGFLGDVSLLTGELAESWELPDDETIIYNLRKGVRYHDRSPANGREVTAEDVAYNIDFQFNNEGCWQNIAYTQTGLGLGPTSIKALDKYTVEVKVPAKSQGIMLLEIGDNLYTNPPECWEEGDGWQEWNEIVGSGPFIISDYVADSLIHYTKHPNYFESDPLNPGNQWPYLDAVKVLIIPDLSSRLAAFRTGKTDIQGGLSWEDARDMMERCPETQYSRKLGTPGVAAGRMDTAPFDDIRVRQAMNLAVNQQEILDDYLSGEGVLLGYPYHPTISYEKYYTPLEEMPEDVKMLFTYNPEKAKQLLADAGHPDGFKTHIICPSASVDEVSMIKAYLDEVNIDMEIRPVETGAYNSYYWGHTHEQMLWGTAKGCWAPFEMLMTKRGMGENFAIIDDPYFDNVQAVVGTDMVKDPDNYFKTMKEAGVYELSLAWAIFMPNRWIYTMWWPWVQNYYGITWSGWANFGDIYKGIWLDSEMKESMGY